MQQEIGRLFMLRLLILILSLNVASLSYSAVDFDGADDSIETNFSPSLGSSDDIVFSAWIKTPSTFQMAENHYVGAIVSGGNAAFQVGHFNDASACNDWGKLWIWIRDTGSGTNDQCCSTNALSVDTWYHIVGQYDDSNTSSGVRLYVDGIKVCEDAIGSGSSDAKNFSTAEFMIGARGDSSPGVGGYHDGVIAEPAMWTGNGAALSEDEIKNLAKSRLKGMPLQINPSFLDFYYPLDEAVDGTTSCQNETEGFINQANPGTYDGEGDDGSGNDNLICLAEEGLSYP